MEKDNKLKETIITKITNAGYLDQHNFLVSQGFNGPYKNYKVLKHFEGDKEKALHELTEKKREFLEKISKKAEEEGYGEVFKKLLEPGQLKPHYLLNALRRTKGDEQGALEFMKAKEQKKVEKRQKKVELKEKYKTQLEFLHSHGALSDKNNIKVLEIYNGDQEKSLTHLQGKKAKSHRNIEEVFVSEGFQKQLELIKEKGGIKLKKALNLLRKNEGNLELVLEELNRKGEEKVEKKKEKTTKKEVKKELKKKTAPKEKKNHEEIAKDKGYHEQFTALKNANKFKDEKIVKVLNKTEGDVEKAKLILEEKRKNKGFNRIKTLKEIPATVNSIYLDATNTFYSDNDIKNFLFRKGDFKVAEEALIELVVCLADSKQLKSGYLFFENRNEPETRDLKLKNGEAFSLHLAENKVEKETILTFAQSLKPEQLSQGLFVTPDKVLGVKLLEVNTNLMKPSGFLKCLKGTLEPGKFEALFDVKKK